VLVLLPFALLWWVHYLNPNSPEAGMAVIISGFICWDGVAVSSGTAVFTTLFALVARGRFIRLLLCFIVNLLAMLPPLGLGSIVLFETV